MSKLITTVEEPKIDMVRETSIEYTECFGNACKSFRIERRMLFCEMIELVDKLTSDNIEKGKGNDGE